MINADDLHAMGYEYYTPDTKPQTTMDMVRCFVTITGQTPTPNLYASLIQEEFKEWSEQVDRYNSNKDVYYFPDDELKELSDLVYVIYGYANSRGWDLDEAVRRVHSNNTGRCYQEDGTIKRREDGKIIKNPSYPKVDLSDLV